MFFKKQLFLLISIFSVASLGAMHKRVRVRKADVTNEKTILYHVINNDKKAIKECLKKGTSIDLQSVSNGQTLLHSALFHNKIDLIKWLLARDARIDLKDWFGLTVLDHVNDPKCSPEIKNIFTPEAVASLKQARLDKKQAKLLKQHEPFRLRLLNYVQAHPENPTVSDYEMLASLRNEQIYKEIRK
jgi:ankyrin repeat protein